MSKYILSCAIACLLPQCNCFGFTNSLGILSRLFPLTGGVPWHNAGAGKWEKEEQNTCKGNTHINSVWWWNSVAPSFAELTCVETKKCSYWVKVGKIGSSDLSQWLIFTLWEDHCTIEREKNGKIPRVKMFSPTFSFLSPSMHDRQQKWSCARHRILTMLEYNINTVQWKIITNVLIFLSFVHNTNCSVEGNGEVGEWQMDGL